MYMDEKPQRKPKPDVRSLISRLSQTSKQLLECEIIAPLLPGGRIRTRHNGMIHEFKAKRRFVGWGRFRPLNEREAAVLGEALPWERGKYLEQFPALRVILLWPAQEQRHRRSNIWWALPYNASDARQRFGLSSEPQPIFLCDPANGAERFERIVARFDGQTLWFDGPDTLADPTHAEWLRDTAANIEQMEHFLPGLAGSERLALLFWQIRQIELRSPLSEIEHTQMKNMEQQTREQQRDWLRQEGRRTPLERALQHALAKGDAKLLSFSEVTPTDGSRGHLMVEWSEGGNRTRYRSIVDPQLTVISSGICLSDRDEDFDLTSLVSVMTDSPWHEV
jgi:hypothetical protein